jgi:hypothetical protein
VNATGVNPTDFALPKTGLGGTPAITSVTPSVTTPAYQYIVTASTGTGDGTLGLNLVDNDSILDQALNKLGGPGISGAGNGSLLGQGIYTIDRTQPTVAVSAPAVSKGQPLHFTVKFFKPVAGFDRTDVTLGGNAGGVGAATVDVTGSSDTYDVAVSGLTSDGTVTAVVPAAKVADLVGNTNIASNTATVLLDAALPTATSISRVGTTPTNTNAAVSWTVTFSEPVSGVDATDFTLNKSGFTAQPAITGVAPNSATVATVFTVTASSGTGSGSLALDLLDDNSIVDQKPNPLAGALQGPAYDIDRLVPSITSVTLKNKVGNTAGRVDDGDQIVIAYSKAMDLTKFCSTWTDGTQPLTGITMQLANKASGSNDVLRVGSTGCLTFGSINLGSGGYVSNSDRNYSGSTAAWDGTALTLTITLGTGSGGPPAIVANSTATYTASNTLTDKAGNLLSSVTKATANNIQQF